MLQSFSRWLLFIFTLSSTKFTSAQDYIKSNLVDDVPQFMRNQAEVNKTILEVEQLIAKNSDLPRLTRGEILSLLENITKEDEVKQKKPRPNPPFGVNLRPNYTPSPPKVMLVLPEGSASTTRAPPRVISAPTPIKQVNFVTLNQAEIETSSQFENLVTLQKSSSKIPRTTTIPTLTEFTFTRTYTTTSERSPLEFGFPMSIKTKTANTPSYQPVSTLAPDVAEVLKTLGLEKGATPSGSSVNILSGQNFEPVSPPIDPYSYTHFKPIPKVKSNSKTKEINSEMQDFLASFGLIPNQQPQTRSEKSMRNFSKSNRIPNKTKIQNKTDENVTDLQEVDDSENKSKMGLLTPDMKKVLENMGLIHLKNNSTSGEYIFNPVVQTTILDQAKEVNKITKVIDGIRELSKETNLDSLSQEEIKAHLDNITSQVLNDTDPTSSEEISIESFESEKMVGQGNSTQIKGNVPDPLAEVNNSLLSDKNEFKRQQPSDGITSSSTEAITTSTEAETTEISTDTTKASEPAVTDSVKAEDSSPSLTDLADSFGGGETASEDAPPEALPSPRPNGLYFYVDWNTFLNVGSEDTKNRVNLRFAPKVGNPRLFLPVSVP